jgi:hypothetical protein
MEEIKQRKEELRRAEADSSQEKPKPSKRRGKEEAEER